ncbi:MAG: DTW domain-containing protein, partial [Proteobacteria bacterium]
CYRCRKAKVMCYCAEVKTFASDPEFVILIHPKETRKAINTGRMAHLQIENSLLLVGCDFSDDPNLNRLLADESRQCYLLFPGTAAIQVSDLDEPHNYSGKKEVFIILDATWSMAKKMFRLSENLKKIPQVMFHPTAASEFLIRQQPGFDCYSTIETIHHIIDARGRQETRPHDHLLTLFRDMVQKQIDYELGTLQSNRPLTRAIATWSDVAKPS